MAEMKDLSTTDASNNGTAGNAGFPEGMPPSDVNNAARALEGMLARWYGDTNGALVSGGTGSAYTLTINRSLTTSYSDGLVVAFQANAASANAATLNVNSKGAKVILKRGTTTVSASDILADQIVLLAYESTNDAWQMLSPSAVGGGDVVGPGSSTDNALPRFDGTGGKTLQGSSVVVDDSNNMSGVANLTATGTPTLGGLAYPTSDGTNGQALVTNGSGTLSFASVSGADQTARNAIAALAFQQQAANGTSLYSLGNMIFDQYEDETGIDGAASTNQTYDASNDNYYASPTWVSDASYTPDSTRPGFSSQTVRVVVAAAALSESGESLRFTFQAGSGADFSIDDAWVYEQASSGDAWDGDATNKARITFSSNNGFDLTSGGSVVSDEVAAPWFDNSKALVIAFDVKTDSATDDPAAKTSVTNWASYNSNASTDEAGDAVPSSSYLTTDNGVGLTEIEVSDPDNMTLVSESFTAASAPSTIRGYLDITNTGGGTPNTDFTFEVSRDGGTTWTTGTLVEFLDQGSNRKLFTTGDEDVTGQPSGTSVEYRVKTLNNLDCTVNGAGVQADVQLTV